MAHSSTAMGDAVAAIVAAMRARSGYRSPFADVTGIPVYHSIEAAEQNVAEPSIPRYLIIGDLGDPYAPQDAGNSDLHPATLGTVRAKEETAVVRCRAVSQTGDVGEGVVQAQWDAALTLVDAVDAELRGPVGIGPTLGLEPSYRSVVATLAQVDSISPYLPDVGGIVVEVPFQIRVVTRL